jgi:hypothetical protein
MIIPAALGLAMLAGPAMAASTLGASAGNAPDYRKESSMTPEQECHFLEQKFDLGIKTHGDAKMAMEARDLRTEGANLCNTGDTERGIPKLRAALKDINFQAVED